MSLKASLTYSAIGQYGSQLITFLLALMLARILEPSDFGLLGMVSVFIGISSAVINIGYDSAIVRHADINDEGQRAILYLNLSISLLIYIILYYISPLIAEFYDMPILSDISKVLFMVVILDAASKVAAARIHRALKFKYIAIVRITASTLGGIVGLMLALNGYGVWSLVVQQLIAVAVTTLLLHRYSGLRVIGKADWRVLPKYFNYSKHIFMTGMFGKVFYNLDSLVVGKLFGASELGYYSRAHSIRDYPIKNAITVIERVMFPHFANEHRAENVGNVGHFEKIYGIIMMVTCMASVLFIVYSNEIVIVLLSEKWIKCVPYFTVMSIFTPVRPLGAVVSSAILAYESSRRLWIMEIMEKVGLVLGIAAAILGNIYIMILLVGIGGVAAVAAGLNRLIRTGKFNKSRLLKSTITHIALSIIMITLAEGSKIVINEYWISLWLALLITISVPVLYYMYTENEDSVLALSLIRQIYNHVARRAE